MITQAKAIRRAYFNDREAPVTFDTCSNISTIEYDDPKHNRIIKVGRRIKINRLCKEHDTSKKDDIESVLKNDPDNAHRKSASVHNKKPAPIIRVRDARKMRSDQTDTHGDSCYNTKGDETSERKPSEDEENNTTTDTTMNKKK